MNNEQQELLDEAYENYYTFMRDDRQWELDKEEFIEEIKTDSEFSEKWGLTIEERELSLEERATIWNNTHNPAGNIFTHNQYDENNIPKRAITVTYNDKKIKSYE
jgi:bifunctional pyridoxal-dependent enzyme with beta-cystathionase and maltose regulon repressor activities